jgi:hypothetical protein
VLTPASHPPLARGASFDRCGPLRSFAALANVTTMLMSSTDSDGFHEFHPVVHPLSPSAAASATASASYVQVHHPPQPPPARIALRRRPAPLADAAAAAAAAVRRSEVAGATACSRCDG